MRYLLIIILLGLGSFLYAQNHYFNLGGAHFTGLGRAGLSQEGIGAIYYNQAGLSQVKEWAIDLSMERRFNLGDLTSVQISGVKRFGFGTFGLLFSQFGSEIFNEQLYGLAYGRSLGKIVSLGGLLGVLRFYNQIYGSAYTTTFALGSTVKINHQFSISSHIFSPVAVNISDNNAIETRFRLGITYKPSTKVQLFAELDKLVQRIQWEYKIGIAYQPIPSLQVQAGFNPNAEFYGFGINYRFLQKWMVRGAVSIHQILGLTPSFSASYGE